MTRRRRSVDEVIAAFIAGEIEPVRQPPRRTATKRAPGGLGQLARRTTTGARPTGDRSTT